MTRTFAAAIFALLTVAAPAQAKTPPTDADIRQQIIQDTRGGQAAYAEHLRSLVHLRKQIEGSRKAIDESMALLRKT